jgi:hypothetical protein
MTLRSIFGNIALWLGIPVYLAAFMVGVIVYGARDAFNDGLLFGRKAS